MEIKILGMGCVNCEKLERMVFNALAELNIDACVQKVQDIPEIMKYGVMSTPGLVINEKVVLSGRVPSKAELEKILLEHVNR
ncbi:thioredoxin family protein [Carboxydothermus pertinax]|nr:thioredoxin family protein [Carboxydothermus pertinax]